MKTIDIKTTQNVTIEYELASLRDRFMAFFIDLIIVITLYLLLLFVLINAARGTLIFTMLGVRVFFGFMISFLVYQLISEILANGQSWGKKAIGIRVMRLDGKEAGLSEFFLRTVFHIIDTFFSFGAIGALLISSSDKNQRLGDLTANTTLIRMRNTTRFRLEDILNINTLENYQPHYPEVRQLSEEDMLLIKETIKRYQLYHNEAHQQAVNDLVKKVTPLVGAEEAPKNKIEFLKTLIRDYIVLTR